MDEMYLAYYQLIMVKSADLFLNGVIVVVTGSVQTVDYCYSVSISKFIKLPFQFTYSNTKPSSDFNLAYLL